MSNGGSTGELVGSLTLLDSAISNTPIGIQTSWTTTSSPATGGNLALENVVFNNVPTAIQGPSSTALAGTTGSMTVPAWVEGHIYTPSGPTNFQGAVTQFPRPASLLSGSKYYARSKPQYEGLSVSSFLSARSYGATGNGVNDDSAAVQNVINTAAAAGQVAFFDAGIYLVTTTISIPPGAKIVGETYPVIMGSGSYFSNINAPQPVLRVGTTAGQTGEVELSDFIVSTQGATAGATLIEWNLASPSSAPSGLWDVHTRIGGFTGANLGVAQCSKSAAQPNANCIAAFQSMHITTIGSGVYLENVWLWSADHDNDDFSDTQITVYSGRGLLVESTTGNIWL